MATNAELKNICEKFAASYNNKFIVEKPDGTLIAGYFWYDEKANEYFGENERPQIDYEKFLTIPEEEYWSRWFSGYPALEDHFHANIGADLRDIGIDDFYLSPKELHEIDYLGKYLIEEAYWFADKISSAMKEGRLIKAIEMVKEMIKYFSEDRFNNVAEDHRLGDEAKDFCVSLIEPEYVKELSEHDAGIVAEDEHYEPDLDDEER